MIAAPCRQFFDNICCFCVTEDSSLNDDGSFVTKPVKVGNSFLLYGRRKSYFPFHCMVGPDWLMVVIVFVLIIAIDAVMLYVISPLGWPPVLIGIIGCIMLLGSFCVVAFSDPGTVYKNDYNPVQSTSIEVIEVDNSSPLQQMEQSTSARNPAFRCDHQHSDTIECGQCEFKRPKTARHCTYCKTCIDKLDHHCPW
jgi:hypothetical protein